MWQSESHLNFSRVGHHSWATAPSHIKYEILFSWDMLQVQKLLKLEEVEVKVEEEPEGEAIVGLSGDALRPPGMGTTFTHMNPSLFECTWTAAPLVVFYIRSSLVVR